MKPQTCSSVTASVTAALLDSIYVQNANISHIKLPLVADHTGVFVIHKAALRWITKRDSSPETHKLEENINWKYK